MTHWLLKGCNAMRRSRKRYVQRILSSSFLSRNSYTTISSRIISTKSMTMKLVLPKTSNRKIAAYCEEDNGSMRGERQ
jgi:hypothetical protein